MSESIGNLAVQLSLDATMFVAGLDQSTKEGKKFAQDFNKTFAAIGAGEAVGGEIFAAGKGAFDWIKDGVDKVADVGREAEKLGVSTQKLSALQFAAGRDSEAWGIGLKHLGVELGAVAAGGEEARKKFRDLGLDGAALAGMGIDKAIDAVADRFAAAGSAAERARLAEQLFGREGMVLIPVLKEGAAGFAAADEAAKRLGMSVDRVDAFKAIAAQRAMDDLGKAFEGLQRTAAIEFAPVLTDISKGLTDVIANAGGGKALFRELASEARNFLVFLLQGLENVLVAVADAGQQIKQTMDSFKAGGPTNAEGKGGVAYFSPELAHWGETVGNMIWRGLGGAATEAGTKAGQGVKDTLDPLIRGLLNPSKLLPAGEEAFDAMKHRGAGQKSFADLSVTDMAIKEALALPTSGLNIFDQYASKLHNLEGAFTDAQKGASKFTDALYGIEQEQKKAINSRLADITRESAPPLEKLKADFRELNELKKSGLTDALYGSALAKDFADLMPKNMLEVMHPAALEKGSEGAYESVLNFEDQGRQQDVQQRIAAAVEMMVKQQAANERYQQQLVDAINRIFKKGN